MTPKVFQQGCRTGSLFLIGLFAIGCVAPVTGFAASRTAPVSKFSGVDDVVFECTNSTTFVNMPQMTRTFALGGTTADEVVVMFQGALNLDGAGTFDTGYVRLRIDNAVQGPGDQVPVRSPGSTETATHGFNWQSSSLSPGSHTARIQWRTDLGSTFCVDARSLIVLHK